MDNLVPDKIGTVNILPKVTYSSYVLLLLDSV